MASYDQLPATIAVASVRDITPNMRRVTFSGAGVAAYASDETRVPNIKLIFPDPATGILSLPVNDGSPRLQWPDPDVRARVRTYTVRRLDPAAAEMDVDFVRHGDEGLASAWAERAQPGDTIGAAAGGGVTAPVADRYLIVGDETALPAIGRMLERLPAAAVGTVFVEVDGPAEEQDLIAPAGLELVWLHRGGAPAGTTTLLTDAVKNHTFPDVPGEKVFAWISAESAVVLDLRRHLRNNVGMDRKSTLVIGYWKRGVSETGYGKAADHDRDFTEHDD